jgi:hypothetical protein
MSTGTKMIVEASPIDGIWGIGFDSITAMTNRRLWGENRLGRCLMIVRDMIGDLQSRIPKGMNGYMSMNTTTVMCCYHCLSSTMIRPSSPNANPNPESIIITSCNDCMKKRGLAFGNIDRDTLTKMIRSMPTQVASGDYINTIAAPNTVTIMHPVSFKLLDMNSYTITKTTGYKDVNGNMVKDWRTC